MGYYELEELPPKPQERAMQAAEKEQLDQQEAEDVAEQQHEQVQEARTRDRDQQYVGHADREYSPPPPGDSVFYPLVEAVRSALLKECKYASPSPENAEALKAAMLKLEDKYRIYRLGPEIMAGAYFVSPFVSGYMIHIKEHPPAWIKKQATDAPPKQEAATEDSKPVAQGSAAPATANNAGASQQTQLGGSAQQRVG